jgi:hypothetical protein
MVQPIQYKLAKEFIEKWHYSGRASRGKSIFFGWFIGEDLYAVADYGIGVNNFQASFLARKTNEPVTNDNLLELKRLCRVEPKNNKYPLTRFLSLCHKELRKQGYKYIVSFSDPEYNHNGGIYKAANFTHLGKTDPMYHVIDSDGIKRHRRYPYKYSKRHNCTIQEARDILGLKIHKTLPKDRWFIKIGK